MCHTTSVSVFSKQAQIRCAYGEAPVGAAGRSGAGLEESGATGSAVWGVKLGSARSPTRGEPDPGESRGTVWRLIR